MTKRVERKFVDPSQISHHLACSICSEVFLNPVRLFCGHTFCEKCIVHFQQTQSTCPVCRTKICTWLMGKDYVATNMIQDLQVNCSNTLCSWQGKLAGLEGHIKACQFTKNPDWLEKEQNYVKIEEDNPSITQFLVSDNYATPLVPVLQENEEIASVLSPGIYFMSLLGSFMAMNCNSEMQQQFESLGRILAPNSTNSSNIIKPRRRGPSRRQNSGEEEKIETREEEKMNEDVELIEQPVVKGRRRNNKVVVLESKECLGQKISRQVKSLKKCEANDDSLDLEFPKSRRNKKTTKK